METKTPKAHPTQGTLAEVLALHPSTVSLALRGDPRVNATTRKRVGDLARSLGYRPNAAARSLATRRTHAIGFVMGGAHLSPFAFIGGYAEALRAFAREIKREDYHLLLGAEVTDADTETDRESPEDAALAQSPLLAAHLVDGLLVLHPPQDDLIVKIRQLGLPCVILDAPPRERFCCIGRDEKAATEQAVAQLVKLGHRRIALFWVSHAAPGTEHGPLHPRWDLRIAGYVEAMARAGLPPLPLWQDRNPLPQRMAKAFAGEQPPTAIIIFDTNAAAEAAVWLNQHGLQVPRDVSLLALHPFTGIHTVAYDLRQITTFESQHARMGELAARKLLSYINHPDQRPESIVLEPVLSGGNTVGPAPDVTNDVNGRSTKGE